MNGIKKSMVCFVIAFVAMFASACHKKDQTEYICSNGDFSVTLPSDWIQDTGVSNGDTLLLYSNEQRDMIFCVQRYDREIAEDTMGLNSLQRFLQFYKINSIVSTLYVEGEVEDVEYSIENMENVIAQEVTAKSSDDSTAKAFCVVAENTDYYYTCTITGEKKIYDKNINHLKKVLSELEEK